MRNRKRCLISDVWQLHKMYYGNVKVAQYLFSLYVLFSL